jgi:transcriptional regulator with XRE-family HTH domain
MPPKLPADPARGLAIRQSHERHGLTQEELATHAGMTFGIVSRLKSVKSAPAWATIRALVAALGCSLSELAAEVGRQERAQ